VVQNGGVRSSQASKPTACMHENGMVGIILVLYYIQATASVAGLIPQSYFEEREKKRKRRKEKYKSTTTSKKHGYTEYNKTVDPRSQPHY
jgi:hypothetical protein